MNRICVFGGTTEGRKLVDFFSGQPVLVTACVATEYGEELLEPRDGLTVLARRMSREEIEAMLRDTRFDLVIDATHPYAAHITDSVAAACGATGTDYLRLLREAGRVPGHAVTVATASEAVAYLDRTRGNILLTTGSKELSAYARLRDFSRRVYARVLPMADSLAACQQAGLDPAHIIAMQGPFSEEMDLALLRSTRARYLVTKDGGATGGFAEKLSAAQQAGAIPVVIGRPQQRDGLDLAQVIDLVCDRFHLAPEPSVAVVGMGPGSPEAMTGEVLSALDGADCLIGAGRMLKAVARPGQAAVEAIFPDAIAGYIAAHREHRRFAVVLSGDAGFFSGAKRLLPLLPRCQVRVLPGLSSLSYFCSRLHTSYEDVVPVSLHGRTRDIAADVRAHPRVFALLGGEWGANALCSSLVEAGLGEVQVSIGERLSYPDEAITVGTARELAAGDYAPLSVALIEHDVADQIVTQGLPDEAFRRSEGPLPVPMTKSEVRAVCLSKLQLTRRSLCWDVGAGTGSVAVEMALRADLGRVYAIEQQEAAVRLLRENRARFALGNLSVVPGRAPEVCAELPAPTHVFVGGSTGALRDILSLALAKNPAARIVATAVSLESVAELTACLEEFPFDGPEVVSLCVARGRPAGRYHLMTGQNPVWIFTLPGAGGPP